jgi:hypothetical protein
LSRKSICDSCFGFASAFKSNFQLLWFFLGLSPDFEVNSLSTKFKEDSEEEHFGEAFPYSTADPEADVVRITEIVRSESSSRSNQILL